MGLRTWRPADGGPDWTPDLIGVAVTERARGFSVGSDHGVDGTAGQVFLVSGLVGGDRRTLPTDSPATAAGQLLQWLEHDSDSGSSLSWTVNSEATRPAAFTARLADHYAGEAARLGHVFLFSPGQSVGPMLTSCCGVPFQWSDLEFADRTGAQLGDPCQGCGLTLTGEDVSRAFAEVAEQLGLRQEGVWRGWDGYYRQLGWPVTVVGGHLMLDLYEATDIAVLSMRGELAEQVLADLAGTGSQPPVVASPQRADELMFVVGLTDATEEDFPDGVSEIADPIPLYPSITGQGPVTWRVTPLEVVDVRRCQDRHVLAAVHRLRAPVSPVAVATVEDLEDLEREVGGSGEAWSGALQPTN